MEKDFTLGDKVVVIFKVMGIVGKNALLMGPDELVTFMLPVDQLVRAPESESKRNEL